MLEAGGDAAADDERVHSASSPDELAFISAAELFGFVFSARLSSPSTILVIKDKRFGESHEVQILEVRMLGLPLRRKHEGQVCARTNAAATHM